VLAKLLIPVEALLELNPRLIVVSISGYGHGGPMTNVPAYDLIVQAASGLMSITGPEGGPGVRVGVSIGDIVPGLYGAIGALAALAERTRTGRGQHVDVAMFDSLVSILENPAMRSLLLAEEPVPSGQHHSSSAPFGVFETSDGQIAIAAANDTLFLKLLAALERTDLASDPRFESDSSRGEHRHDLETELNACLKNFTTDQATSLLTSAGVPCGPVLGVRAALNHPQSVARGLVVEEDDGFQTLAAGVRLANSELATRSAPSLGQDNDQIPGWLAESPKGITPNGAA
jgi:CoA:oxalate CoA-transferase